MENVISRINVGKIKLTRIAVTRNIYERKKPVIPVADLSGKGIFDEISSNRSKQNDQHS